MAAINWAHVARQMDRLLADIAQQLVVDGGWPEHFLTRQELEEALDSLELRTPAARREIMRAVRELLLDEGG